MKAGRIHWAARTLALVAMVFFTVLTVGPLFWVSYSSFKPHAEIVRNTFSLPSRLYLENYREAWELGRLGIYAVNSVIYTAGATTATVLLAMATGYGFAKFRFRISGFIYAVFMMGLLITIHSVLVPLFILETRVGIGNTRLGVVIPYVAFGLPMAIYLATSYIRGIPDSLEESAVIDGANYLGIFARIIMPVATPVAATITILTFLTNWNEFALVYVLTSKTRLRSLPVGINSFAGVLLNDYGLQFAAIIVGTLPMIVFYVLFHEQLARGFAEGALKG